MWTASCAISIDQLNTWVGKTFAWCILVLTFTTSYEVFSRYFFGAPTDWAFDASYILYGTLFMMAGAYTLARNSHVRGDFLYRAWQPAHPGEIGPDPVHPVFLSRHDRLRLFRLWLRQDGLADERALGREPERTDHLAVQMADSRSPAC